MYAAVLADQIPGLTVAQIVVQFQRIHFQQKKPANRPPYRYAGGSVYEKLRNASFLLEYVSDISFCLYTLKYFSP